MHNVKVRKIIFCPVTYSVDYAVIYFLLTQYFTLAELFDATFSSREDRAHGRTADYSHKRVDYTLHLINKANRFEYTLPAPAGK